MSYNPTKKKKLYYENICKWSKKRHIKWNKEIKVEQKETAYFKTIINKHMKYKYLKHPN